MKLKKIIAVVTAAAMVMGSSISVFADTATGEAVNATGSNGKVEGSVNKQIYQVKLPTSTQVENYFGSMILDPELLITETGHARYDSVNNPASPVAVGFDDDASGASVLFRKEVSVSGDALTSTELTAVTYSATSATLEAVNYGTVPVTISAITKVVSLGAVDSDNSSAYRNIKLFKNATELTAATLPGVLFTVTGSSVDRSGPTATSDQSVTQVTGTATAITGTAIASGSATIIKAVTAAPVTAYAITYSAVDDKYAYVVTGDAATSASVTGAAAAGVSGLAVNPDFEHFSKFTFVMAGKAAKSDYKYWKYLTDAHPAIQIVWEIAYDDEAEDRNEGAGIDVAMVLVEGDGLWIASEPKPATGNPSGFSAGATVTSVTLAMDNGEAVTLDISNDGIAQNNAGYIVIPAATIGSKISGANLNNGTKYTAIAVINGTKYKAECVIGE